MYLLKLYEFSKNIISSIRRSLHLNFWSHVPIPGFTPYNISFFILLKNSNFPPNYSQYLYISKREEGADLARHFNLDKPETYAEMGTELKKEFQNAKLKEKSDDTLGDWVKNGYSNNKGNFCEYFDSNVIKFIFPKS